MDFDFRFCVEIIKKSERNFYVSILKIFASQALKKIVWKKVWR